MIKPIRYETDSEGLLLVPDSGTLKELIVFRRDDIKSLPPLPAATFINLDGCSSITHINAPVAVNLILDGCAALTHIDAPRATDISARYCIFLTHINAPLAIRMSLFGCVYLPQFAANYMRTRGIPLLTATGKTLQKISEHWYCHTWENCPMAFVFGVDTIGEVPEKYQKEACLFISLFDSRILPRPI